MDTKVGYNGYPAQQPPSWDHQAPPPPQYGEYPEKGLYQQPPPQYPNAYQQQQHQLPPQPSLSTLPLGLEVEFTSWSGRHMRVTEGTRDGPLAYSADLKNRKPNMIFKAEGSANLPATVTFHTFSRSVDISINGEEFAMRTFSIWKCDFGFHSPALGGKHIIWKRPSSWNLKCMNIQCTDENGTVYARFESHSGWSGKKCGRLNILEPAAAGGKAFVDELVVTGLANVYLQIQTMMAANGSAASSAGVAAAVA
ncbi:hypothetical protein BJX70DRAFT_369738 [Aspergillus crustosus]